MSGRATNPGTIAFYDGIEQRCAEIARLPVSQHQAAIAKLCKGIGVTPNTIAPIIEKYAHLRLPDYPVLAKRFVEKHGAASVRTMIATNHGLRDLKAAIQDALINDGLPLTGARVIAMIDAIKAQFHAVQPIASQIWAHRLIERRQVLDVDDR